MKYVTSNILFISILMLNACSPRVEVVAPDKPITINMNIKIDHEVRVKVDKQLEKEIFNDNSELF